MDTELEKILKNSVYFKLALENRNVMTDPLTVTISDRSGRVHKEDGHWVKELCEWAKNQSKSFR